MIVRRALPADLVVIAELSRELARHVNDPDPGADASLLIDCGFGPDPWFECLVAEDQNRIVGFALFCRIFEAHTRTKRLWLGDLYVAANRRRDGVGNALLAAIRARAIELGCAAIDFELAHENDAARGFYEAVDAVTRAGIEPLRLSAQRR